MGIDKIPEFPGLETATAVANAVGPTRLQHFGRPGGSDEIVFKKNRIPEMKIHRKAIHLDVHEKRGGEVASKFKGLKALSLPKSGRRDLSPFAGVGNRRPFSGQVHDGTKLNPRADVVDDSGG